MLQSFFKVKGRTSSKPLEPLGMPGGSRRLWGGLGRPLGEPCLCKDARTGVLGACGSSAHVHGQPRSRQFRVQGLRLWILGTGLRV